MFFGNVNTHIIEEIKSTLPFRVGQLPVRYLGVPLLSKRLYSKDCKHLIDKVKARIGDWKNKFLSYAGRLQLITSVLSSLQVYWASVFTLPVNIIDEIEGLMRKFLWSQSDQARGKAKVNWEEVCKPKWQGGLGIKSLKDRNKALMTKHIWNIITHKESIWVKWINIYKLKGNSFWDVRVEHGASWSWSNILKNREDVRRFCVSKIGDGTQTSVWFDMWHPMSPIGEIVTKREIHRAGLQLGTTVAEVIQNGRWNWPEEWRHKFSFLYDFEPPNLRTGQRDGVEWKTNEGQLVPFTTGQTFVDISYNMQEVEWHKIIWYTQNIPRHAFILWLAIRERLLTQDRIRRWERNDQGELCGFCNEQPDSHRHLFFECGFPNRVWMEVQKLAEFRNPPSDWQECVHHCSGLPTNATTKSIIWRLVLGATVYFIWQERNVRVFQKSKRKWEEIVELIKESVKLRLWGLKIRDTKGAVELSKTWGFKVIKKQSATKFNGS